MKRVSRTIIRLFIIAWVSPNSVLGLLIGMVGLFSGGKVQMRRGCLEFYGGAVTWLLGRIPPQGVTAMTLGHTIIGQEKTGLAIVRDHEHVHVRQYERWGPIFIPVYLGTSLYLMLRGRDCYRENPFEVEAFATSDPSELKKPVQDQ